MSTMTSTGDQEAIRVANRYAAAIEKATTLLDRARACDDAATQYRRDARANTVSAQNHQETARTIRNPALSHQHTMAARDAEAEAAREILAARMYEQQAETYLAEAHGSTPAAAGRAFSTDGTSSAPVTDVYLILQRLRSASRAEAETLLDPLPWAKLSWLADRMGVALTGGTADLRARIADRAHHR